MEIDLKAELTEEIKKRKYKYKTLILKKTKLKGWMISEIWSGQDTRPDVKIDDKGNIRITLKKQL